MSAIAIVSVYLLCVAIVLFAICMYGNKKNGLDKDEK